MSGCVLMSIEGVLSDDLDTASLVDCQSLDCGLLLFHALRQGFQIVLSTLGSLEVAESFLRPCGIRETDYAQILHGGDRISHLRLARRLNYRIDYFIDTDPEVAVEALRLGCVPMLCPHPAYGRSSFLPDIAQGKKTWDQIAEEVQGQRIAKSQDSRLTNDEVVLRDDDL
jgi:hypothetical protein